MDREIIEKTAVNILETEILSIQDCLSPYVSTNDKTPFWDGSIYIYNSSVHSKENYEGKIEVQVKGRQVKKLKCSGNSKFTMDVDDLVAYKKNINGTLLIVVEFIDIKNYQLYYANLLPVDLHELFKNISDGQKTKTIDVKPIVSKSASSLKFVCLNFLKNSNKQANRRIIELNEMDNLEEINFEIISTKSGFEDYIKSNAIYSYGITKDTKEIVSLPLLRDIRVFQTIKQTVMLDNEKISFDFTMSSGEKDEKIIIGKSLVLNRNECRLEINLSGNLYSRINDLKLLNHILVNKNIITSSGILELPLANEDEIKNIKEKFSKCYDYYIEVKEMFDYFKIEFLTDFDMLTDKDINNINLMINLIKGKCLEKIKELKTYTVSIDKYTIFIMPKVEKNTVVGVYNLFDDLSNAIKFFMINEKGSESETSIYYTLTSDNIKKASNFDCSIILNDIKRVGLVKDTVIACNQFILNLLNAYDETRRKDLLDLANEVQKELLKFDSSDLYLLNEFQIKYRLCGLEIDDKIKIKEIYDRGNSFVKAGAAILLSNLSDYEIAYNELGQEERDVLQRSPIFNILNNITNK